MDEVRHFTRLEASTNKKLFLYDGHGLVTKRERVSAEVIDVFCVVLGSGAFLPAFFKNQIIKDKQSFSHVRFIVRLSVAYNDLLYVRIHYSICVC